MGTVSRRNLLVRSENWARQRTGILANNFQCDHTQRLNACRLPDQSGKMKPRNVPEDSTKVTGYIEGGTTSQVAARSHKLGEIRGMLLKFGPKKFWKLVQHQWCLYTESTLDLRECSRRNPNKKKIGRHSSQVLCEQFGPILTRTNLFKHCKKTAANNKYTPLSEDAEMMI